MGGPKFDRAQRKKIVEVYQAGATCADIAQHHKVYPSTIARILKKEGVQTLPGRTRIDREALEGFLSQYQAGEELPTLAEDYDISYGHACRLLKQNGIVPRGKTGDNSRRLTDNEWTLLIRRYIDGEGVPQLAKAFGINRNTINAKFTRLGIPTRTRSEARRIHNYASSTAQHWNIIESAFDELTEEALYWLGFIMCDGHIRPNNHGQTEVVLDLSRKDIEHVRKFHRFLGAHQKLSEGENNGGHETATLVLRSDKLAKRLAKFGIVHRKNRDGTGELTPDIALDRHVWRGCIDANGTVRVTKQGYPSIQMAGWVRIVEQFVAWAKTVAPEYKGTVWSKGEKGVSAVAHTSGSYAIAIIEELYGNCSVYLNRKYETAQRILGD
jgi:transposase-like protein